MRFALFALVAAVCVISVVESGEKIRDKEGYHFHYRPALGHFAEEPYFRLYQHYAVKFVQPYHPDRPNDDYRNFVPSAEECVVFFEDYKNNGKQVQDFDEFVMLDACLGYLYQSTFHAEDTEGREELVKDIERLKGDSDYKAFFDGTKVDDDSVLSKDGQRCVGNLLLDAILAKAQFQEKTCNNAWIQVFVKFAECSETSIPEEIRENDSYLRALFALVKQRASGCFENEITTLNEAVRDNYANKKLTRASNKILGYAKTMRQQASDRMWPKPIQELLAAVQGVEFRKADDTVVKHLHGMKKIRNMLKTTDKSQGPTVNLRTVAGIVKGVTEGREEFLNELLTNMALYADKKIKPSKRNQDALEDSRGSRRYRDLVDNLCMDFRSSDREEGFDFGLAMVRMVRMLPYEKVLGVSKDKFVKNVLTDAFESAPLYLSLTSCNILTHTRGAFVQEPSNGPLHYKVSFNEDTSSMVKWPVPGHY